MRSYAAKAQQDEWKGELPVLDGKVIVEQRSWYQAFSAGRRVSADDGTGYRGLRAMEVKVFGTEQWQFFLI